jgi:2-oxoisovalerate dehydrogenase E1 component
MDLRSHITQALLIRRFEEKLLELFAAGELHGTIHTCIGQEWTGIGAAAAAKPGDTLFSNHRCHGHFIAWTGNPVGLLAEIMGREAGVCGGLGGSQHLHAPGFYSNGIQGGLVPVAAGRALAHKLDRRRNICLVFIGDGTLGQGVLYETMNIASKWELPLLVVVENNRISQSTPQVQTLAGSIEGRAAAFDIEYRHADTWAWAAMIDEFQCSADYVRDREKPCLLEIETARLKSHSKGDDTRSPEEIAELENRDPIRLILEENDSSLELILGEAELAVEHALAEARKSPPARLVKTPPPRRPDLNWEERRFEPGRVAGLIHDSLQRNIETNPRIVLIGEDIESPYGGAFKVTKDLSDQFPELVRNAPISEAAMVGIGTGLALGGYLPVVEIMFGDFLTLAFDQLVNHACKMPGMYNGRVSVPLIVRTPMGGRRGYGPTHSQSLEKHLLGVPGLVILALNQRVSPALVYDLLFETIDRPTLVIENKVLYAKFLKTEPSAGSRVLFSNERYPTVRLSPLGHPPEVTVFCYGGMLAEAERALEAAFDEHDVIGEIVCPLQLQPLDLRPVLESVRTTRRLVTVEEGPGSAALGGEVIARLQESGVPLDQVRRIYCDSVIPCSRDLESRVLPGADDIVSALLEVTCVEV